MKRNDWIAGLVLLVVLLVIGFVCCPVTKARADSAPLLSAQRVLVTAGLDYALHEYGIKGHGDEKGELKPSLNVAYNLGNYSSLVTSYSRGVKAKDGEFRAGIRIRLYNGKKVGEQ